MIEKILERLEKLKMKEYNDSDDECEYSDPEEVYEEGRSQGRYEGFHEAIQIVQEVAHEYGDGWIPYTTNGELPNNGQRVWLSFTTPYTSYVKSAWWIYDHFEWGNCKKVKDYPLAWKPYKVPAPYNPKGE